ncbi:MAG: SRPBCC domain-containing protein [Reichenbachiella sp.]|uniref:SRPBCC domain-containing protein n=1 Tax=Reichenbachiella sp. TaxID=2184521 RepID=UPI003267A10D
MSKSYSKVLEVSASAKSVYKALTQEVDKWWTVHSNPTEQIDDELKVRFGETTYKTMKITKAEPNKVLHWLVTEAFIDIPELILKDEWVGTTMSWKIETIEKGSKITFAHKGLVPAFECYEICQSGWDHFLSSLSSYLNTGIGSPHGVED